MLQIENYLDNSFYRIDEKDTVTSTNDILKELAKSGEKEGYVLIANHQTKGRGRLNRTFYSPDSSGIYMSILFRPELNATDSLLLTTCCAVAVAEAIEEVTEVKAEIKWVNDIYVKGKKVSGILTESGINADGTLNFAVVGIGINITEPQDGFPDEIKDIAGAISTDNDTELKSKLIAEILNRFYKMYLNLKNKDYYKAYKNRSFLIGKTVSYIKDNQEIIAEVLDIDTNFSLIVKDNENNIVSLSTGEVSVRLK